MDFADMMKGVGKSIWNRATGDVLFNTHRSGTLYAITSYLMLKPTDKKTFLPLPIPFPCSISVNGRSKIIVTEVDGLVDSVKEDMGFAGYDLSISFEAGDYGVCLGGINVPGFYIPARLLVMAVANLVRNHRGPVNIIEGVGFNFGGGQGIGKSLMAASVGQVSQILQGQASLFDVQPSMLSALGIHKVVFQTISVNPGQNHTYQISLTCTAEMDVEGDEGVENLFLTEDEYKDLKAGG
jgi:hypothetical protein